MCVLHFKSHIYHLHPISFIISIHLLLLISIPVYHAQGDYEKYYSECSKNATFRCGETVLGPIKYPFWGENIRPAYCGLDGFELSCENSEFPVIDIGSGNKYRVANITIYDITLNRYADQLKDVCAPKFKSAKLNEKLFEYMAGTEDLYMFHGCPVELDVPVKLDIPNHFTCTSGGKYENVIFGVRSHLNESLDKLEKSCQTPIKVPVNWTHLEKLPNDAKLLLEELLRLSFLVHYKINETECRDCWKSDGVCFNATNLGVNAKCLYQPVKPGKLKYLFIIQA